jgi:hypothetical protein
MEELRPWDLLVCHYDTARVNMVHPQNKKLVNVLQDEGLSLFSASLIHANARSLTLYKDCEITKAKVS